MSQQLCLDNEDDIFKFILSRNISVCEQKYINSINSLESIVNNYVDNIVFDSLVNIPRNFNNNCNWINNKYKDLVKLKISLDLVSTNIISFYENK